MRRAGRSRIAAFALVFVLVGVLLVVGLSTGCSAGSEDSPEGPRVVATTSIVAEMARKVAGTRLRVDQLLPDGASPHDLQLSARDRADAESASLIVENGAGLEAGLGLDSVQVPRFALIDHVGPLLRSGPDGRPDPHFWMDPDRMAAALPDLARAFSRIDPSSAGFFRNRAQAEVRRLERTGREMSQVLSVIPAGSRKLVTSHDSLAWFCERFAFEFVAAPFPSSGAEAEASAASVREAESAIERAGVPAVFPEAESNPRVLEQIASRTGVEVIQGLRVEGPAPGSDYTAMLLADSRLIARGLGR